MTRSQIAFVAALTVAILCAATWLSLSSAPGTVPDVVDAAIPRAAAARDMPADAAPASPVTPRTGRAAQ